jgi:hypothetical protein
MSDSKFDAPLRLKLHELEQTRQTQALACFVQCRAAVDEDMAAQLEASGLKVQSIINNIVVARGEPEAIRHAAAHEFVVSIELGISRSL